MPSIRWRFTDEPMPNANTLAWSRLLAHQLEHLALDRHVAVGHDDHAARHVGRLGQRGDALQRRHDLGAAAAAVCVDGLERARRCWPASPAPTAAASMRLAAGEQHHVEAVARAQRRRSGRAAAPSRCRAESRASSPRCRPRTCTRAAVICTGATAFGGSTSARKKFSRPCVRRRGTASGPLAMRSPAEAVVEDEVAVVAACRRRQRHLDALGPRGPRLRRLAWAQPTSLTGSGACSVHASGRTRRSSGSPARQMRRWRPQRRRCAGDAVRRVVARADDGREHEARSGRRGHQQLGVAQLDRARRRRAGCWRRSSGTRWAAAARAAPRSCLRAWRPRTRCARAASRGCRAMSRRSPMRTVIACTAAAVEPGNT